MKKNLMLSLVLCLGSAWVGAQVVDSLAVVREVDRLIQISVSLEGPERFAEASCMLEVATQKGEPTQEKMRAKYAGAYDWARFEKGR